MYEPNAIVSSTEIFPACQKKAIEMGCAVGAYFSGKMPEAEIEFGLPFNHTSGEQYAELMWDWHDGAFYRTLDEAYCEKGLHVLGSDFYLETLMSKFPVNKIDDIKGY